VKKPNSTVRRNRINKALLSNAEAILDGWLQGEARGEEFVALNPLRDDGSPGSFSINLSTGVWKDFAIDDFGGHDLVSLYMALNKMELAKALDELEAYPSRSSTQTQPPSPKQMAKTEKVEVPLTPAPVDCHFPPDVHPDLGAPSKTWEYKTAEGQVAFLVYRFDTPKGKETRPVCYNPEKQDWQWKLPTSLLPVYNLDRLVVHGDSPVVVVEGEKAADAAVALFPEFVCTTSASGSSNAHKSDWSPVYEREVTLVPDADEPGLKYAKTVAAELLVNGGDVFIVDTHAMGWTDGRDVADYPDLPSDWLIANRRPIRDWGQFKSMDTSIVEAVAGLSPLDYDRRKDDLVDLLGGVNKRTLDSLVKKARQADADADETESDADSLFAGE
jgi:putative DNA primase/helicase